MTRRNTQDALTVFWDGEEVPGIIAYGYWRGTATPSVDFPPVWPWGTDIRDHWMANWKNGDQDWRVLVRTVRVTEWPDEHRWESTLEATLKPFMDAGARVAWFGVEGHFVEPPGLFQPAEMSGGVWAALTQNGRFPGAPSLSGTFEPLPDDELRRLKAQL